MHARSDVERMQVLIVREKNEPGHEPGSAMEWEPGANHGCHHLVDQRDRDRGDRDRSPHLSLRHSLTAFSSARYRGVGDGSDGPMNGTGVGVGWTNSPWADTARQASSTSS